MRLFRRLFARRKNIHINELRFYYPQSENADQTMARAVRRLGSEHEGGV